jgi:hypothetical protein
MSKSRFLLRAFFKLCLGIACVVGAIAAYRFLLHPLIASALSLGEHASSMVRRVNIFFVLILSYWAFVRYYERRAVRELSLPWRWILLGAVGGVLSIGVTILVRTRPAITSSCLSGASVRPQGFSAPSGSQR